MGAKCAKGGKVDPKSDLVSSQLLLARSKLSAGLAARPAC